MPPPLLVSLSHFQVPSHISHTHTLLNIICLIGLKNLIGLTWHCHHFTLTISFPHEIQAHSLFLTHLLALTNRKDVNHQKDKNLRPPNWPKLPFFRKNTPQKCLAAATGHFDQFSRHITKSRTPNDNISSTQPPNIDIVLKYEFSHWTLTVVTVLGNQAFTS